MNPLEQRFIQTFVVQRERERYLGFLSKPKHRRKLLHVMAFQHELDGCDASLDEALDVFLTSPWGVLLIGPPRPVTRYKWKTRARHFENRLRNGHDRPRRTLATCTH